MIPQSRLRRMGWIAVLALCTGLYLVLHLKVHAVRSDVVRAERQIVQLEQDKLLLETEFETRANQQQLANWNRLEFGYRAPTAEQFVESERKLAQFGVPRGKDAPAPIRVARNDAADGGSPPFPRLVSPLTGKPVASDLLAPPEQDEEQETISNGPMRVALGTVAGGSVK